jgi:hypothetical protein
MVRKERGMIRIRFYFDKDSEAKWINEMSEGGWAFESFILGVYTFRRCEPGEYIYQIDFLENWAGAGLSHKEFMNEMNVETVQKWYRWVYLRKKKSAGPFELYSDNESLIRHYTKIRNMFKVLAIIEICCMMPQTFAWFHTGSIEYIFFTLALGLMAFMMFRQAMRCNFKIWELRGKTAENRTFSPLLIAGLLLNSLNIFAKNLWETNFSEHAEIISTAISAVALIFMAIGIIQQVKKVHAK